MRLSQMCLGVALCTAFLTPAFPQTNGLPPAEILPAPWDYREPVIEFFVPKERVVSVNLSVDRPTQARQAQFKLKRSGQVLAESSRPRPEALEFEVLIEGPCDVPVFLPVADSSGLKDVYEQYGESDPDKVAEALAELGIPHVSLVAIHQVHHTERHEEAKLNNVDSFNRWVPHYRVSFKHAATPPVLVKVPLADCDAYQLMRRRLAHSLCFDCEMLILTIAKGEPAPHNHTSCRCGGKCDCHRGRGSGREYHDDHDRPGGDYARPRLDYTRPPATPPEPAPRVDPGQADPLPPQPVAPDVISDPFGEDAASPDEA